MKKIRKFTLLLTVFMLFIAVVGSIKTNIKANTDDICLIGLNVNDKLKDVNISHEKKDLAAASLEWNLWNYQYVRVSYTGSVDNSDASIKEGDYFTLKLDSKININGIVDQSVAIMPNLKDKTTGEVFAIFTYDKNSDTIKYVFNKNIEKYTKVDFSIIEADFVDGEKLLYDGNTTFTHSLGNTQYSYSYNVIHNSKIPDTAPDNETQAWNKVGITKSWPLEQRYEHVSYHRFYDTNGKEIVFNYTDPSPANKPEIKIYAVPVGLSLPDSFGVDLSTLNDVTDTFTKQENASKTIFKKINNETTDYVVIIHNDILPDKAGTLGDSIGSIVPSAINPDGWTSTAFISSDTIHAEARTYNERTPIPCAKPREADIKILKIDSEYKKALSGATLALEKKTENEFTQIEQWESSNEAKVIKLKMGEYILKEKFAPKGYKLAKDIHFKISPYGVLQIRQDDGSYITANTSQIVMIDEKEDSIKDAPPTVENKGSNLPPKINGKSKNIVNTKDDSNIAVHFALFSLSFILLLKKLIKKSY